MELGNQRQESLGATSGPISKSIDVKKNVHPDVIAPSEDSGLSSISTSPPGSVCSSLKADDGQDDVKPNSESTIGEGIQFADPSVIAEEMREKEAKIKRQDSEMLAEKRRAKEAYQQEIQEKQYKCLMHLLSKSKAMSRFLNEKVNKATEKESVKIGRKGGNKAGSKRGATTPETEDDAPPPKKKGRKPKQIKQNLSEEDISKELDSLIEDEEKENSSAVANYVKSKYFVGDLRDYQKIGLNWLKALYDHGLNGILADEMGLGKTIQVIALFAHLIEKRVPGPYLVIVPLSTLPNWISEFERFAPELPVVVFYGSQKDRGPIRNKAMKKVRMAVNFTTHPIILTTYQMPLYEQKFFKTLNYRYIVIDEAQRIKNFNTQLFKVLKMFNSVNRLLLTGTPLQNNLSELWSLLNYLLPEIFNDLDVFESWFDAKDVQNEAGKEKFFRREQEKQVMFALREILQPFMLRRLKEEVCPDIPPFKEVVVYTPLTSFQHQLYSAILNRDLEKLYMTEMPVVVDVDGVRPKRKCTQAVNLDTYYNENYSNIVSTKPQKSLAETSNEAKKDRREEEISKWRKFATVNDENVEFYIRLRFGNDVMMYRHVVNHPYIIHQPLDNCGLSLVDENLIKISGKMLVLDAMLKKLKAKGHKILLFSTMRMVLDVIEDHLNLRNYQYVRLDGTIKYEDRRCNIDKFQTDPDVFIFLLTTKAGAVGLNLAAADTVIIYDSDYNPQNDLQAMARCHRIGQTKPVVVYRLCTKGTVDEEIINRANAKRFLEKAVISKEGSIATSYEGLMALKKLLDENTKIIDSKKEVYTEAELEEMLDRSDMLREKKEETE
ncbi:lymphocyte-specific helicase [Copidosoma floridanum]|uniref:lymphocyte-specific helicase n=1 Tax=Copidosoma floridanum TaxID=29053 RepID=UPI0006C9B37A|nr:lymphocyte-specific helicase [Copidosoma floridanum]